VFEKYPEWWGLNPVIITILAGTQTGQGEYAREK
jgi:hypothetical protein